MQEAFLQSAIQRFQIYKSLGERAMAQLSFDELQREVVHDSNSIGIIVRHLRGNMLSRWTDFLTSDGEKTWRHRDTEFEGQYASRATLEKAWEEGWACLFEALANLQPADMTRTIYIREEPHTVMEAIIRQLTHYSYHIGQVVLLAKHWKGEDWQSLSIPRGKSEEWRVDG
jgi:uncharacterized damage-inducible protein DinB